MTLKVSRKLYRIMEGLQENIFKSELAKPADVATLLDQMKLAIEGKKKYTIKSLIR